MSIWFWNFGNPSTDFEWVWFCLCNVDDFSTTGTYLRASYGLPWCSDGKESACNARDLGSILGSGRSLGEGNGNLVQYSCLENPMYRGAWWATVHGVAKSRMWLSTHTRNKVTPWVEKESNTTERLNNSNNKATPPASSLFIEFSARHAPGALRVLALMYS